MRKIKSVSRAQKNAPPALITHKNRSSLAPFVLFDAGSHAQKDWLNIDWHPHSGVATITLPFDCHMHHADSDDNHGVIKDGGMQWMASGSGVWHKEQYEPINGRIGIHQLWLLLPPGEESSAVNYFNCQAQEIPVVDNTRVLLGHYKGQDAVQAVSHDVTYLEVSLKAGEQWLFDSPASQTRGFLFPRSGSLLVDGQELQQNDFAQFEESAQPINVTCLLDATFVVALTKPWQYEMVHEYGQMHTNWQALQNSKKVISEQAEKLREKLYAQ